MGLLTDTKNGELRMHRECRERFPHHRLQRKRLVSDPSMHHGTSVTHVPWCMSGLLARGGGENVPAIPGACTTRNFTYLARGLWASVFVCFITHWTAKYIYLKMVPPPPPPPLFLNAKVPKMHSNAQIKLIYNRSVEINRWEFGIIALDILFCELFLSILFYPNYSMNFSPFCGFRSVLFA